MCQGIVQKDEETYIHNEFSTKSLKQLLANALPDQIIFEDVKNILKSNATTKGCLVELDATWISVPLEAPVNIIARAFYDENLRVAFGTYRVLVAIGDIVMKEHGHLEAAYCFATLYYDDLKNLITIDFDATPP